MVIVLADKALADSNAAYCPDPALRVLAPLTGSRFPSGSAIELMGTAMIADAAGYQVNVRPAEGASWILINERRKGQTCFLWQVYGNADGCCRDAER